MGSKGYMVGLVPLLPNVFVELLNEVLCDVRVDGFILTAQFREVVRIFTVN